jgi:hypothetical protein
MTHLMRSRLILSLIVATLFLCVVLLSVPLATPQSALAAGPTGEDVVNITRLGSYPLTTLDRRAEQVLAQPFDTYLVGNILSEGKNVVEVFNTQKPGNPQRTQVFGFSDSGVTSGPGAGYAVQDIFVDGPLLYAAVAALSQQSSVGTFWSVELGPSPPVRRCWFIFDENENFARVFSVVGDLNYNAYVGTSAGITVLNAFRADENGRCPKVGQHPTSNFVTDMVRVGTYLYVATGSGVEIFDILNPTSPSRLGSYDPDGSPIINGISANARGQVFLASSSGVLILDFSNPASPHLIGTVSGSAESVDIGQDRTLYIGSSNTIRVVDVSDPGAPREVGRYIDNGPTIRFQVSVTQLSRIHTQEGIYQYTPPTVDFTATAPTVLVNGQPLPVGSTTPIWPPDKVTLAAPNGKGEVTLTCQEVLLGLAQLFQATEQGEPNGELIVLLIEYEALLQKYCNTTPTPTAQGTDPDIGFMLESGGMQAAGLLPNLRLDVGTANATARSDGMNRFSITYDPETETTTIGCLVGSVQVVPTNGTLPPFTLGRNEQVTVTADTVSEITPYGSTLFLPLTRRD